MPPHLLVVGAGNSLDPGPARLRQEAKRGARRRRLRDRRRDRAASAVTGVFFYTAWPERHQISGMWTELEERGSTAKRQQEELLHWQQIGGCRTRWTRSRTAAATVPKVPYRPDGEASERTRVT